MELPNERFHITIPVEYPTGPMELHIDYFDADELIRALDAGKKAMGLDNRIFITISRPFIGHEPSEWLTTKESENNIKQ